MTAQPTTTSPALDAAPPATVEPRHIGTRRPGRSSGPRPRNISQYSRFVAWMKLVLPTTAAGLLLLVAAWPHLQTGFERVRMALPPLDLNDARDLRMVNAHYSGIDRRGRPFTITAEVARETSDSSNLIALEAPKADMTTDSGTWIALASQTGIYQSQSQLLDLFGEVSLIQDRGNEFHTDIAHVDMAAGTAQGQDPVEGHGPFGHITARGFHITDHGDTILFTGPATMLLEAHQKEGAVSIGRGRARTGLAIAILVATLALPVQTRSQGGGTAPGPAPGKAQEKGQGRGAGAGHPAASPPPSGAESSGGSIGLGLSSGLGGEDNNKPIQINADEGIEWQQANHLYIARGNARATRGQVTVYADVLKAYYRPTQAALAAAAAKKAAAAADPGADGGKPGAAKSDDKTDDPGGGTEIYRLEADGHVRIATDTQAVFGDHAAYDVDQALLVITGKDLRLVTPTDTVTARDSLEWYDRQQLAVARGEAVAIREQKRLRGDVLTAQVVKGTDQSSHISRVDAQGNVMVSSPDQIARGDAGVYNVDTGIATITGRVTLTRADNVLRGRYAVVDLNHNVGRLLSEPPNAAVVDGAPHRVQGLIMPRQKPEGSEGDKPKAPAQPAGAP